MVALTFNPATLRVKQARLGRWFEGYYWWGWWSLWAIDVVLAVWLGWLGNRWYGLFAAAAGAKTMALLWYSWWLKSPSALPLSQANGQLEQVIEGQILGKIARTGSPQGLWQSLSHQWQLGFLVSRFGFDQAVIAAQLSDQASELPRVWSVAYEVARRLNLPSVTSGCLVVTLILTMPGRDAYLNQLKLNQADLISGLLWQLRVEASLERAKELPVYGGVARDWAFGYTPLLNRFADNLSLQVERGLFHLNLDIHGPLVEQVLKTLGQPVHNSVVLVGETGTGKTTLAYSLAETLLTGRAPDSLKYHQVLGLNASALIAAAGNRGELEALVLNLLGEAAHARNIILFLDNAQLFFSDDTGGVNLTNILQPLLQRSDMRLLLSISPADWQQIMAKAPDLAAQLNYQAMAEPDAVVTLAVLEDQALAIEAQTRTTITYQAVREAYRLAERYGDEQMNPGKSLKVLLAAANYTKSGVVTAGSVQQAVESTRGVKVGEASVAEKDKLLNLESYLHRGMVNQQLAVKVVADALRRARAGVKNPSRPVGSFLFLGPTGVGKTQLAKVLADVYFGGRDRIIRVDMSEYANAGDEQRLLAGELSHNRVHGFLSQLRRQPFSVVLLDEVEKAHPQVLNLLLQLLDEGHLTDQNGRRVSFQDAIVIATSNAGADEIRRHIEVGESLEQFNSQFIDSLINQKTFLPELINRFDEVVLFRPLNAEELKQVVDLMLGEVNQELKVQKVGVTLTDDAKGWLVAAANDPRLGARPLRRTIQRTVENVVAKRLLGGSLQPGQQVELSAEELKTAVTLDKS